MKTQSVLITFLLLNISFVGCFGQEENPSQEENTTYPKIWDRHTLEWNTSGSYSLVLEPGPYSALEVQEALISVDTSSVWELSLIHI